MPAPFLVYFLGAGLPPQWTAAVNEDLHSGRPDTNEASGRFRYGRGGSENGYESLAPGDRLVRRERDGKIRITHTGRYIGDREFMTLPGW